MTIIAICVIIAIVCGYYAAREMTLDANTDDLISRNRPFMKDYIRFTDEFGDLEYLYVVVANNGEVLRTEAAVDALTARLRRIKDLPGVYSAITPDEQLRIATRAMSEQELADFSLASGAFGSLLEGGGAARVLNDASALLARLIREGAAMPPEQQERVGGAAVFLLNAVAAARSGSPSAKEMAALIGQSRPEYFKSDTGKLYFITVIPQKDYNTLSVIEEPLRQIRAVIAEVRREYPGIEIGLTGKPVLQADEMATTNRDMTIASLLGFLLCAVLFVFMLGGLWRPLLLTIAFVVGSAWTYGFATLLVGRLNLLSIVFMLVLVGIGSDYGVYLIARYKEYRLTHDVRSAITGAIMTAVRGNITAATTSSSVFFMALLTTFEGLRELGLIAGGGLLLCLLAMSILLPALLVLSDRHKKGLAKPARGLTKVSQAGFGTATLHAWLIVHPAIVLVAIGTGTLLLSTGLGRLQFEKNLLKLQATGLESIAWEHRVLEDSASSSWFGAVVANDLDHVQDIIGRARLRPTIGAIHSVLDIVQMPTPQREQLRKGLHDFQSAASQPADAPAPSSQPAANQAQWTADDLRKPIASLNLIAIGAAGQAPEEAKRMRQIAADLTALANQMASSDAGVRNAIEGAINAISRSLRIMLGGDSLSLREALPESERLRFTSPASRFLVMLHPKDDVWEYEPMGKFVNDLRAVDPDATGAPILHFESIREMLQSFLVMSALALLAIVVLVWLDFRHMRDVILAIVPLSFGLLWTIEAMSILGISFNLANFFSVPILIGTGVGGSVQILHRYREGGPTRFSLGSTRPAVMLAALTTIIGFGCLLLAHHRGLRSLGAVMAMGSLFCLLASLTVLPALLAWLEKTPPRKPGLKALH